MPYALNVPATEKMDVAATSAGFTTPMRPGQIYRFVSTTACWVKVTTTAGAAEAAAAGNIYCAAGEVLVLCNVVDYDAGNPSATTTTNGFVKAIRASADGTATLTPILKVGS